MPDKQKKKSIDIPTTELRQAFAEIRATERQIVAQRRAIGKELHRRRGLASVKRKLDKFSPAEQAAMVAMAQEVTPTGVDSAAVVSDPQ